MTYQQALQEFKQAKADLASTIEATARAANLYRIHSKGHDGVEIVGSECYPARRAAEVAERLNQMPAYIKEGIYHWVEPVGE